MLKCVLYWNCCSFGYGSRFRVNGRSERPKAHFFQQAYDASSLSERPRSREKPATWIAPIQGELSSNLADFGTKTGRKGGDRFPRQAARGFRYRLPRLQGRVLGEGLRRIGNSPHALRELARAWARSAPRASGRRPGLAAGRIRRWLFDCPRARGDRRCRRRDTRWCYAPGR